MAQVILLFLSVLTLLSLPTTEAQPLSYICPNTTVFTPNSTFQSNLNHLLSTLSSNSTRNTGFYNATADRPPSETIYGLFLCRGDVTTAACKTCVTNATSDVVRLCPVEKEVVVWCDECMLRYSNKSFFTVATESPGVFIGTLATSAVSRTGSTGLIWVGLGIVKVLSGQLGLQLCYSSFSAFESEVLLFMQGRVNFPGKLSWPLPFQLSFSVG